VGFSAGNDDLEKRKFFTAGNRSPAFQHFKRMMGVKRRNMKDLKLKKT
jgi:hypothetical protein